MRNRVLPPINGKRCYRGWASSCEFGFIEPSEYGMARYGKLYEPKYHACFLYCEHQAVRRSIVPKYSAVRPPSAVTVRKV